MKQQAPVYLKNLKVYSRELVKETWFIAQSQRNQTASGGEGLARL